MDNLFYMNLKVLVDGDFTLEKFPQKGGWTYVLFPELEKPKAYFGMLKVTGKIDSHELGQVTLMPFGNGKLFLPVNAQIRKLIQKGVGDLVRVNLFLPVNDEAETDFSEAQILECLKEEPMAWKNFQLLSREKRDQELQEILRLQVEDRKVEKIVQLIERLRY